MTVHLHIERLVLDESLLHGERAATVGQAIERELAKRFATMEPTAAWWHIGAVPSLPSVTLRAPRHPGETLGARVADAVGQSINAGMGQGRKP